MKRILCSWLVFFVCINALGSISACVGKLGRAITGGAGAEPGLISLIGRIMNKGMVAPNNNGNYGTVGYGPPYAGQFQGSYSTYNQQPVGSTYYPNQALLNGQTQPGVQSSYNSGLPGSTYYPNQALLNGQTQPGVQSLYNSGLPVQSNLSQQPYPVGTGTSYQPAMMTNTVQQPYTTPGVVQPAMTNVQPGTTPVVQTGNPQRYIRR